MLAVSNSTLRPETSLSLWERPLRTLTAFCVLYASTRLLISVLHLPNQVTPQDDLTHAHRRVGLFLFMLLCLCYHPYPTLHPTSPLPRQTSLSGADFRFYHSQMCN
jgi:hypothetical protein